MGGDGLIGVYLLHLYLTSDQNIVTDANVSIGLMADTFEARLEDLHSNNEEHRLGVSLHEDENIVDSIHDDSKEQQILGVSHQEDGSFVDSLCDDSKDEQSLSVSRQEDVSIVENIHHDSKAEQILGVSRQEDRSFADSLHDDYKDEAHLDVSPHENGDITFEDTEDHTFYILEQSLVLSQTPQKSDKPKFASTPAKTERPTWDIYSFHSDTSDLPVDQLVRNNQFYVLCAK